MTEPVVPVDTPPGAPPEGGTTIPTFMSLFGQKLDALAKDIIHETNKGAPDHPATPAECHVAGLFAVALLSVVRIEQMDEALGYIMARKLIQELHDRYPHEPISMQEFLERVVISPTKH